MSLLIGFLTFVLVVNCLFLILLVLVQLPKKEAGAGLAFGAGAVDTLIGAGSGNALTKMTKYAAGTFLGMAVLLAVLNTQRRQGSSRSLQEELARQSSAAPMIQQPVAAPTAGTLSTGVPAVTPTTPTPTPLTQPTDGPALKIPAQTPPPANSGTQPQP